MKNIDIKQGISVIGNISNTDIDLSSLNNQSIKSFKTLDNGKWKSWSRGTPDAFQGFNKLGKGTGYVVNSDTSTQIAMADTTVDINTLSLKTGLALLAFPFDDKTIASGYLPRMKMSTMKTIDGTWKSWTKGTPDAFQGFTKVDSSKGYVCVIDKVYNTYLFDGVKTNNSGVTLIAPSIEVNKSNPNLSIVKVTGDGVVLKDVSAASAVVTVRQPDTMLVDVDGTIATVEFPPELSGEKFTLAKSGIEVISLGRITETVTSVESLGRVTDSVSEVISYGNINSVAIATNTSYIYTFAKNTSAVKPDSVIVNNILEIMYDAKTVNLNRTQLTMNIEVDGVRTSIKFTDEYLGSEFIIIKDNKVYTQTFKASTNFITI